MEPEIFNQNDFSQIEEIFVCQISVCLVSVNIAILLLWSSRIIYLSSEILLHWHAGEHEDNILISGWTAPLIYDFCSCLSPVQLTPPLITEVQQTPETINISWINGYEDHVYLRDVPTYELLLESSLKGESKVRSILITWTTHFAIIRNSSKHTLDCFDLFSDSSFQFPTNVWISSKITA